MMGDPGWVVRFEADDSTAAGPFDTYLDAEEYVGDFDDVYVAREKR